MAEDYDMVMQAVRTPALKRCLAFADSLGSAVVCHINHRANTSSTGHLHTALRSTAFDADDDGAAFDATFNRLFETPCRQLLAPVLRHIDESRERTRPKFSTSAWASRRPEC